MRFHLHFDEALRILGRTWPFLVIRIAVVGVAVVLSLLWFGGVFVLFQNWFLPGPAWLAWVFGGIAWAKLARLLRNYLLYLVKAGHIAVITQVVSGRDIPQEWAQVGLALRRVSDQFVRVSVFFAVDRLVNRILIAFNRTVFRFLTFLPSGKNSRGFLQRILDYSVGYVDEAVLSYTMLDAEANPWTSARRGLVLYVQNWQTVLATGAILAVGSYVVTAVVAAPLAAASLLAPPQFRPAMIGVALGLGAFVKFALVDPFAMTSIIVNYHRAIEGQQPDASWETKLRKASDRFDELGERALNWEPGRSGPEPEPGSAPA